MKCQCGAVQNLEKILELIELVKNETSWGLFKSGTASPMKFISLVRDLETTELERVIRFFKDE